MKILKKIKLKFLLPLLFLLCFSNSNALGVRDVIEDVVQNVIIDVIDEGVAAYFFYAPLVYDLLLDEGIGDPTYDRESDGTVKDYNDNIVTCASDEARFEGARRVHSVTTTYPNGRWSSYESENAIEFDGADDDIKVADNAAIQDVFDGGGTISCWIKPKSAGESGSGKIFDKSDNGTNGFYVYLSNESGGESDLVFTHRFSANVGSWDTTARSIPNNQFTHVVITYDNSATGNHPTFYINGAVKTYGSGISRTFVPAGTRKSDVGDDFYIGNQADGAKTTDGAIDNLQMWATELSQANVTALYNATSKATSPVASSVGWWKLDDTDQTITDYSGNGNTGTFRSNTTPGAPANVDGVYDNATVLTTLQGVLIEEQRENEAIYSEAFSAGDWVKSSGATVTANQALSPDGINTTADSLDVSAGADARISQAFVCGSSGGYVMSIWLRSVAGSGNFPIRFRNSTEDENFDLLAAITTTWQRFEIQLSGATTGNTLVCYPGNSLVAGENLSTAYAWGAQVEAGSFASSYIATAGAAATRLKDVLYYPASGNVNEAQGSMVCDFNMLGFDSNNPGVLTISDNSLSDYIMAFMPNIDTDIRLQVASGSSVQATFYGVSAITYNTDQSIGMSYKVNNFAGFIDGSSLGSDTSGVMPVGLSRIYIGSNYNGSLLLNGTIKEVKIWKTKLSDSEMQTETVWSPWNTWGS